MSDVAIAQNLIQEIFPARTYGNVKAACWAAYRRLRLSTERRAIAIWRGEARRIEAHEMDALRREKARLDANAQVTHLHQTAAFLAEIDPDFYRETIDQLRSVAHGVSPRDQEE